MSPGTNKLILAIPSIIDDILQHIDQYSNRLLPMRTYHSIEIGLKYKLDNFIIDYPLEEVKLNISSHNRIIDYYSYRILEYQPPVKPEILVLFNDLKQFTIINYVNYLTMVARMSCINEFDQLARLVFDGILTYDGDFIPDLIKYVTENEKVWFRDSVLNKLHSYIIPLKSSSSIGKPIEDIG